MTKRTCLMLLAFIVLAGVLLACTAQAAPAPTETPTALTPTATTQPSATARPTIVPTVTPTPLSPDAQVLKDIVFSDCIPLGQSFPDDLELSWNLLVKQDFSVFVFDPLEDTSVKVPRFDEETSEGYNKYRTLFFISPDGKWLAYSDRDDKMFVEPADTLIENKDIDRIVWDNSDSFIMGQWVDNNTIFGRYPREDTGFYPSVLLDPITGEKQVFYIEELPNYVDNHLSGPYWIHYKVGDLVPSPTMERLIYPTRGDDYKVFNTLWDIRNKRPLAQVGYFNEYNNSPLWSQDGADVLIMGPNQDRGPEWFLVTANGVVRQITQFSDIFQEPNYWLTGFNRSWDGQFLAFEIFYLFDEPEEGLKYIILDIDASPSQGYCIPLSVVSWGFDSPKWSPDSKYLVVSDNDENSGYGDIFLIDNENKVRYKIGEDMIVLGWIAKPEGEK